MSGDKTPTREERDRKRPVAWAAEFGEDRTGECRNNMRKIVKLLSTLPPAAAGGGWKGIETAPKDGTPIDAWCGGEFPHRIADVEWRASTESEWWTHGGDTIETPAPTWHDAFGPLGKDEQPTHWMPRPPAPHPDMEK